MNLNIAPGIDVALLVLNAFVLFFLGLIFYLRREDRREGYPLEDDITGRIDSVGGPLHTGTTKSFKLPFGQGTVTAPTGGRDAFKLAARRLERSAGAPLVPTGNPLVDGIGPAAWAERAKRPDLDMEGHPRIVPLSSAEGFFVAKEDADPVGYAVVGADGAVAGTVRDLWIDKADRLIRYIEVTLEAGAGEIVLAPMMMAKIDRRRGRIVIDALLASQFAGAPRLESASTITLYEEERVQAYFGGGYLYATADRQEPFL